MAIGVRVLRLREERPRERRERKEEPDAAANSFETVAFGMHTANMR